MRGLLLGVVLTCAMVVSSTAQIKFADYNSSARKKAKSEDKLILIEFTASWCGPCKMMKRDVFSDKEVGDFYNKNFVCTQVDVDNDSDGVSSEYGISGIPAFVFVDSEGELVYKFSGYHEKDRFMERGDEVLRMGGEGLTTMEKLNLCIEDGDIYCSALDDFINSSDWKTEEGAETILLFAMEGNENALNHYERNASTYQGLLGDETIQDFKAYLAIMDVEEELNIAFEKGSDPDWKTVEQAFRNRLGNNYKPHFIELKAMFAYNVSDWVGYIEYSEEAMLLFAEDMSGDDRAYYLLDEFELTLEMEEYYYDEISDADERATAEMAYRILKEVEKDMSEPDAYVYDFLWMVCDELGKTSEAAKYEELSYEYAEE